MAHSLLKNRFYLLALVLAATACSPDQVEHLTDTKRIGIETANWEVKRIMPKDLLKAPRPTTRMKLAMVFISMGALIECLQGLTTYRSFEWLDIVADALGVTIAWVVVTVQFAVHRRFRTSTAPIPHLPE